MAIHVNNHRNRGPRYCPLMKEMCLKGWTKSMGQDEKTGERPVCAAWQPVEFYDFQQKIVETLHDCSAFGWPADLMTEVAQEVSQNAASTDKVATEVQKHRRVLITALSRTPEKPIALESENGEKPLLPAGA